MPTRILALTLLSLTVSSAGAGERVAVRVSPRVAFEPADVHVHAMIEANPDNRVMEIVAESDSFYRSSEIPLEGELSARTTSLRFPSLPSGRYVIRAVVRGPQGEPLGASHVLVTIVGR